MTASFLIPVLSLTTMLIVLVLALISKERTEERRHDPTAPVSTLATDGKFGGVAFLRPWLRHGTRIVPPLSPEGAMLRRAEPVPARATLVAANGDPL
jgi:hypothetical protein